MEEGLLTNAEQSFESERVSETELKKVKAVRNRLYKKVGQLTLECVFLQEPARMPD